ncbi:MAG TPA: hypothetical protein DDW23_00235, partial [Planctomycetes bacterium]|nr:hypothetical protein [Planctomycetota bacterium]
MGLTKCHVCEGQVSVDAVACPHCGHRFQSQQGQPSQIAFVCWIVFVLGGFVLVGGFLLRV